MNTELEGHTKC